MSISGTSVCVEVLDSGYVVSELEDDGEGSYLQAHRAAETTLYGAVTLVARALGYHGTIEFGPRTVAVPVVDMPDYTYPEGPILTTAYGLGPGPAVDDDEPPLRAGTATKPDDLL